MEESSAASVLIRACLPTSASKGATGSLRRVTGPLTTLDLRGTDTSDPHALRSVLPRPKAAEEPPIEQVRSVIDRVREGGDVALREMTKRSEEHTSELQSLMRISYAVFCLKKK